MNSRPINRPGDCRAFPFFACLVVVVWGGLFVVPAVAQDAVSAVAEADSDEVPIKQNGGGFTPAIELLPESIAGLIRIPDLPKFCDAFEETNLGQIANDPAMQPFVEAQRQRIRNYLESANHKVGLRPEDLYEIVTGEAVFAWLPFEKDKRRPFAFCVVADTRGARAKAEVALKQIDEDLTQGGSTRKDITYRGQEVRIYTPERKPGQLKIEQVAITLSDERIIAADRDSVVTDLLDAIAGEPKGSSISTVPDFKTVLTRAGEAMREPLASGGGAIAGEWFARPFQMGRILRETFNVDRGNDIDFLKLLEKQGFDAIKAAGGIAAVSGKRFDALHSAFVLAPPTTDLPSKYQLAARMLQLVNTPREPIPGWVGDTVASFNRLHVRIEEAFWASETLIDEAMGDEIFRPMINGIAKDEDGPQIDLENNVLPNLDNQIILLTDNTEPIGESSERMLVAIRVLDGEKVKQAIRKAMEVEPDTTKLDVVPGVEIWRVEPGQGDEGFDSEAFDDLVDLGFDDDIEEQPPLLQHWAIALVDQGKGSTAPYLMFSSHSELLIETVRRIQQGAGGGFEDLAETQAVTKALRDLGCKDPAYDRVVRLKLSVRAKYELLRQGKLKESDSVLASLYRRLFTDQDEGEQESINADSLPPMQEIEKYFSSGGSYVDVVEDGWSVTGFLLK